MAFHASLHLSQWCGRSFPSHLCRLFRAKVRLRIISVDLRTFALTDGFVAPRRLRKSKSKSPPANENGLLFITGTTPAELKSKTNMTKVRKKAMDSYLEKEKKPTSAAQGCRPRLHSEASTDSPTSIGSDQQEIDILIPNREVLKIVRGENRKGGRWPSSPLRSPASSSHDTQAAYPEARMARVRQSRGVILPSAPIVRPSRTDVKLEYDEKVPRPFQSIGKPLDPFRTMFQAHHPRISVEGLKFHCSRVFGTRAMGQHWIPTLVMSPHAFLSTLCIASAHLDAINHRPVESVQTLALRQEVIHLIGQNLGKPESEVDDFNIIALMQLIASEIIAGEEAALNFHESGVEAMVKQRGGTRQLGVNGRLASTLSWVSLESAILRETKPTSIYTDYCSTTSSKAYPNTATIPESPLFCPRRGFETIKRSKRCSPRALELLRDIRMMMDFSLHETQHGRQNSQSMKNLYKKITSHYPSVAELQETNVLTRSDWTYEAIRVAAILQATAMIERAPLSEALHSAAQRQNPSQTSASTSRNRSMVSPTTATLIHDSPVSSFSISPSYAAASPAFPTNPFTFIPSRPSISSTLSSSSSSTYFPSPVPAPSGPTALLTNLKTAVQNSDLSDCWADMAGVLFWISLVAGAASRRSEKVLRKWYAALAMRCSIMLCFEHQEAIHASLLRMSEFVQSVGVRDARGEVTNSGGGLAGGKRRRV